LLDFYLIF